MRISDWSSDVCSSDLVRAGSNGEFNAAISPAGSPPAGIWSTATDPERMRPSSRSEEHTSELQSLMRISYAVFCLKKKTQTITRTMETITLYHNTTNYYITKQTIHSNTQRVRTTRELHLS